MPSIVVKNPIYFRFGQWDVWRKLFRHLHRSFISGFSLHRHLIKSDHTRVGNLLSQHSVEYVVSMLLSSPTLTPNLLLKLVTIYWELDTWPFLMFCFVFLFFFWDTIFWKYKALRWLFKTHLKRKPSLGIGTQSTNGCLSKLSITGHYHYHFNCHCCL